MSNLAVMCLSAAAILHLISANFCVKRGADGEAALNAVVAIIYFSAAVVSL